ncbi:2-dehydro-3-deoxy-D-gluconate 5-dehydrogenase [Sodalis glossinidius str. 'morsitans']|uniref:2-dehydro-3-deoxy-D-gluconate 5-dehydrogenase n=1 Tax=Sodalis glossinidius (strain morsitans) TaxID=343509 RepID=A0A193QJT4_SODGM|nr:2-dehydro-3-deoxy-D-gluconate 5-dehydrogenase [Sodalis glossinidius str. 'morsitans']
MILESFALEEKVTVVTGCDTGLGQGMAIGLAEAGCDIVDVNIVEPDDTARQVEARGRRFLSIKVDLSDTAVIAQAVATFGHIDILVNNAGIIRRRMLSSSARRIGTM